MSQTVENAFDGASFSGAGVVPEAPQPQAAQADAVARGTEQAQAQEPQAAQQSQAAQANPVPRGTEASQAQAQGQTQQPQAQAQQPQAQPQAQAQQPQAQPQAQAQPEAKPAEAPITDWAQAEIDLAGYEPNAEALASFGQLAVNLGLTPSQAQGLARWQMDYMAAQREVISQASIKELNQEWGARAGANQRAVNNLIDKVDGILGNGSFRQAIEESGADCSANFVRGLLAISGMFSEDSLNGQGGQPIQTKPESALEGITEAFKRARGN